MGSSGSKNYTVNSDGEIVSNIRSIKRIDPNEGFNKISEIEDKKAKKLNEINENDEYDIENPEYHEYMFFSMKNGTLAPKKDENLDLLLKSKGKKKKKQLYTVTNDDNRLKAELADILHIEYDLQQPQYPYSIKKIKCDKPPKNSDYLVIEYNMNRDPENNNDIDSEDLEDSIERNEINKKFVITSRVVHTNNKNCKISNYVYTKANGERYDFLELNQDTNQVRKLKIKQNPNDEEKAVNEKEENELKFLNKNKKGIFKCKKMV